ncbi:MAG: SDR family oxidoreductase [Steroidobacteraceae bacterium]
MDLSGKVLVLTGSDGVLGRAAAATLGRYGARLALLEHGQTSAAAQPGGALHFAGIDLTRDDAARAAMERVVKETGRLDGLVERGITVNAILPSTLDTPKNRLDMPKADFTRWVAPAEAAEVIAFLLSDQARAVTGALIPIMGRV